MERKNLPPVLFMLALLAACTLTATAAADNPAAQPSPDNAYSAFAEKLQESVRKGDAAFINEHFDAHDFVGRMFGERKLPTEIIEKQRSLLARDVPLGKLLTENVRRGGKFKFIRLHKKGDETRALFRMLVEGGFNYFDFLLSSRGGAVKIADVYVFSAGELLSESVSRDTLAILGHRDKRVAAVLSQPERDYMEYLPKVRAIRSAMRRHDPDRALTLYLRLPRTVQTQRNVALLRVYAGIAKGWDSVECERALAHMRRHFPESTALHMLLFQYHNERKEYAESLEVVAALEKTTGDTAYMAYLRGNVFYMQKRIRHARSALREAVRADPALEDAHSALVTINLQLEDWKAVSRRLTELQKLGVKFGDLTKIPVYSEYVKTPEYEEWKSARPAP